MVQATRTGYYLIHLIIKLDMHGNLLLLDSVDEARAERVHRCRKLREQVAQNPMAPTLTASLISLQPTVGESGSEQLTDRISKQGCMLY